MGFTETWLHQDISDDNIFMSGLQDVRAFRGRIESDNREGSRLDVLVTNRGCDVILVTLTAKNGSVSWTLNCWPLGSDHII